MCTVFFRRFSFQTSSSNPGRSGYSLRFTLCLALLGAALCSAVPTRAATLAGATLSWEYYAYGSLYYAGGNFLADGTVGGTFHDSDNYFNIIADATSITFDYSVLTKPPGSWTASDLSLAPTIHNGIAIDMVSPLAFASVTLDPATTMVGFTSSNFSFTANQIQIDWQNLPFNNTTVVKLDITTVPEPVFPELLFACIGAALTLRRRLAR
jgi:hypothetical protein